MKTNKFFASHPVFTKKEFIAFQKQTGSENLMSISALLHYHEKVGNILHIRRGLYASIPISSESNTFQVNPYLIAGRIVADSVLAYHTALDVQGFAYSIFHNYYFITKQAIRSFKFQDISYHPIKKRPDYGIVTINREGLDIKVTSLERTFVDLLDRPEYGGGWSEIWSSFALIPLLNIDQIIEYAFLLNNATLVAKIGFFLEQHRGKFLVSKQQLSLLQSKKPLHKHYLERDKRTSGQLVKKWNLIVPEYILKQQWEESNEVF